MWFILVLMLAGNGQSPVVVPVHYLTIELCEEAGRTWDDKATAFLGPGRHVCVPARRE